MPYNGAPDQLARFLARLRQGAYWAKILPHIIPANIL